MSFEEFQDGHHDAHLGYWNRTILVILNLYVHIASMPPIKFRLHLTYGLGDVVWRLSRWSLGYQNGTISAILNLYVTPMPPIKFRLNLTNGLGRDVIWIISWISEWNDFSNSESLCHFNVFHQASSLGSIWLTVWEEMSVEELQDQSSRKRRIRHIFTPIFVFVRVKFPSEDSHLRSVATRRPNWTSKMYRGLPKFLLFVEIDTGDVQKLSKSPPTFNELYDVCPAYLLKIRYLCWLSFKDVPLSACGSFTDIGVKRRGTLLMAAWSLCVFVTRAELINWCLYN